MTIIATLRSDPEANFQLLVEAGDALGDPAFNKMIDRIQKKLSSGILDNTSMMEGTDKELYEAIEFALSKAPDASKKRHK